MPICVITLNATAAVSEPSSLRTSIWVSHVSGRDQLVELPSEYISRKLESGGARHQNNQFSMLDMKCNYLNCWANPNFVSDWVSNHNEVFNHILANYIQNQHLNYTI